MTLHAGQSSNTGARDPAGASSTAQARTTVQCHHSDENGVVWNGTATLWRRLIGDASVPDREERLRSASAGVVYAHQYPSLEEPPNSPELVDDLIVGRPINLTPHVLPGGPIEVLDDQLDAAQRHAVRQALSVPDIFIIQGAPGSGTSRVLAEIVRQAVRRGQRVLFTAARSASLEQVACSLAADDFILPLYWPGPNANASGLPDRLKRLTLDEQARLQGESAYAAAVGRVSESHRRVQEMQHALARLAEMEGVASAWEEIKLTSEKANVQKREIDAEIRRQSESLPASESSAERWIQPLRDEAARHAAAIQSLASALVLARKDREARKTDVDAWTARVRRQEHVVEVRQQRRVLTWTWWRTVFQSRSAERLGEFVSRQSEAEQALRDAEARCAEAESLCRQEESRHSGAAEQIVRAEIARRHAAVDALLDTLHARREQLTEHWRASAAGHRIDLLLPNQPSTEAIAKRSRDLRRDLETATRDSENAGRWLQAQAQLVSDLQEKLPGWSNVAIAEPAAIPPAAIPRVPSFARMEFDLLVLDDADLFAEADLRAIGGQARRWILGGRSSVLTASDPGRPQSMFHRLWNRLHCDPTELPYHWIEENGQLTCRLVPVPPEERFRLERELVADHPEIELRIWAPAQSAPRLAEVVFPSASYPISRAKSFVFHELEELAIRPEAACVRWNQHGQRLVLETAGPGSELLADEPVPLGNGVTEYVHAASNGKKNPTKFWATSRLEFDIGHGWSADQACRWLADRTRLRDVGRTSPLHVSYRNHPEIAAFVQQVMPDGCISAAPINMQPTGFGGLHPGVEFVNIGAAEGGRPQGNSPTGGSRPPYQRGKAGKGPLPHSNARKDAATECRLDDPRQRQRLPADLQTALPAHGVVSLAEADAMLAWLRKIVAKPAGRADSRVRVAVLAWDAAQLRLLSHRWQQEKITSPTINVCFAQPAEFRGMEADVVLLSLRPGDAPGRAFERLAEWRTAFASARCALWLFGNPTEIARRAQQKPAPAAARTPGIHGDPASPADAAEVAFLGRLLTHLEALERRPRAVPARATTSA